MAEKPNVTLDDLQAEQLIIRTYCETTHDLLRLLEVRGFDVSRFHEVNAESDLVALLEAGFGVAFVPFSAQRSANLARIDVTDVALERTVYLYGVAGRQRTAVAGAMMKMLRSYNWSQPTGVSARPELPPAGPRSPYVCDNQDLRSAP